MITNFEDITYELDEYEMSILPNIVKHLKLKVGESKAVTCAEVVAAYKKHGCKMTGPRWRKIVNFIRVNSLVPLLMSSKKGYYIAEKEEDILRYMQSLKERINSITSVYDSIENQYRKSNFYDKS